MGHVNELDGSGQTDVTREHLAAVAAQVRAKTPDIVLMLSAAGSSKVSVLASVSEAKKGKCSAKAWVESTLIEVSLSCCYVHIVFVVCCRRCGCVYVVVTGEHKRFGATHILYGGDLVPVAESSR